MGAQSGKGGAATNTPFQTASNQLGAAAHGYGQAMGYQPYQIQGGVGSGPGAQIQGSTGQWGYNPATAAGINPSAGYASGTLANTDLAQYMNPYTDQVINQTMGDLDRARQMAMNQTGAQAQAGNAFGGGRHALMEAQTNSDFFDQQARASGALRNQGFQNAQQAAQFDIGNQNQASQFNLGQDLQSRLANMQNRQFNAGAKNQASQFAQQSGLQQALANASNRTQGGIAQLNANSAAQRANQQAHLAAQQMRMGGADAMANLGLSNFGIGQSISQNQQGQANFERMLNQGILDRAQGQFDQFAGKPQEAIDMLNSIFNPSGQGTQTSTPGALDYLGTLIGAYGAYAASDRRLKDSLKKIGKWKGFNLYTWKWTQEALRSSLPLGPEIGVVAQEVAETRPDAVTELCGGFMGVNYGAL
jgi:hypothetical protein